jgi:ATP-binding cassette subfamily C protein CydC
MARIVSRYFESWSATMPRCASPATCACGSSAAPATGTGTAGATRTGELLARLLGDIGEVDGLLVRAIGPLVALGALSLVAVPRQR